VLSVFIPYLCSVETNSSISSLMRGGADSLLANTVRYYEQAANLPMLCQAIYYRTMPLYEKGQHAEALLLLM
jgi:hypothetical protein